MIVTYFDHGNFSVLLALRELKEFFWSEHDRETRNSAFLSYAILQTPAGGFVDRFGVK